MPHPTVAWHPDHMPDLSGRTFVITGANSGLGYQMSLHFARRGARIVMACRNMAKAQEAARRIQSQVPGARLDQIELNLADLASVRRGASHAMRSPVLASLNRMAMRLSNGMLAQPAHMGAWPAMYAAVQAGIGTGDYVGPDGVLELRGRPCAARVPQQALDDDEGRRFWELSEQACGFRYGVEPTRLKA